MAQGQTRAPADAGRSGRALRDVARTVSTVCNPFVVPLVLFVLLCAGTSQSVGQFWLRLSVCAAFTSVGPMLFLFWLYATERISDLDMSQRDERQAVFTVFVIFYLLATATLWAMQAPAIVTASMAAYTV